MAFERLWKGTSSVPLTSDGTPFGVVTVADTAGFKVKGIAYLTNSNGLTLQVQINQVLSNTTIVVGKIGSSPSATLGGSQSGAIIDVSMFTVALNSTITFAQQPKNKIKADDIDQAVYEADPTVALRTIHVDQYGNFYDDANPLPVTGNISIGESPTLVPKILNINLTLANTDYTVNFPDKIHQFAMKVRDSKAVLKVFDTSSGPSYEIPRGSVYESQTVKNPAMSLIVQATQPNCVLEIFCFVRTV